MTWFDIYIESFGQGRIIFLALFGIVSGLIVGWFRMGWLGHVIWLPVIGFLQLWMFFTADYVHALIRVWETGATGNVRLSNVFYLHLITHPAIILLGIIWGRTSRHKEQDKLVRSTAAISPARFVSKLDVLGSHPELAVAGWFPDRWYVMTASERKAWAEKNIVRLRLLWLEGEDQGFEAHGLGLPMRLAQIDRYRGNDGKSNVRRSE